MPATSDKILHLRQLLAERFGQSGMAVEEVYSTGFKALDEIGLPRAAITEIVSSPQAGPGGALLLYGLLHASIQKGDRAVLIDGKDSFQPQGLRQADLDRLLWTRCRQAGEAIKAADLIVRDGNIPLVLLLLTLNPASELRRVPPTVWHRLQMLAEKSAVTLLVFTPAAQIGSARLRLSVSGVFPLGKLHRCRSELLPALDLQIERRRVGRERGCDDEELCRAVCA